MFKLLAGILLLGLTITNLGVVIYLSGLKTYKLEGELPKFYSYTLLEGKIKEDYEDLRGQNVLVEKGSNRIIKVENYNITGESLVSGSLIRESNTVPLLFENESIIALSKNYSDINSVTVEKLGNKNIDQFLVLTPNQINSLVTKKESIDSPPQ